MNHHHHYIHSETQAREGFGKSDRLREGVMGRYVMISRHDAECFSELDLVNIDEGGGVIPSDSPP